MPLRRLLARALTHALSVVAGCDFIEDAFEETFSSPTLNFTRWLQEELDGQEHCIGLPPAGNTTCTMMMAQQVKLAAPLPGGGVGAVLSLSQAPCNNPANPGACCNSKNTTCAQWAGAHLVSAGCIQWGVLEIEAAFNMPANAGGFYFTATYVVYGATDPAWNEIDIGMINNVLGDLEFHATVFTADKDTPTTTMMDALNFAAQPIGTSVAVTAPVAAINNVKAPKVFYNSSFAAQFHTYKVVWTKNTVSWLVDTTVYRNISYAPWRPMSIRQILRTNKGINAVGPAYGDSNVYLRRIRYTPLSDKAVADAYRCTSMFACYGAMPKGPTGVATSYVSLTTSAAAAGAGGRRLLDAVSDAGRTLELAVAALVPGVPSQDVDAAPTAFGITFRLIIDRLNPQGAASSTDAKTVYDGDALQASLISGLADDVIPGPRDVVIKSVSQDASGSLLYVTVMVNGYKTAQEMQEDFSMFALSGAAQLDGTAAGLNNALGVASNSYIMRADSSFDAAQHDPETWCPNVSTHATATPALLQDPLRCPSYPNGFSEPTCVDDLGQPAAVWCAECVLLDMDQLSTVVTYAVAVPVAATATSVVEAMLATAQETGALGSAVTAVTARRRRSMLTAVADFNLTSTSNLVVQRLCDNTVAEAVAAACAETASQERQWRAVSIAFVIGFGVLLFASAVGAAFVAGRSYGLKAAAAYPAFAPAAPSPSRAASLKAHAEYAT